jgi:hypothetical protein
MDYFKNLSKWSIATCANQQHIYRVKINQQSLTKQNEKNIQCPFFLMPHFF